MQKNNSFASFLILSNFQSFAIYSHVGWSPFFTLCTINGCTVDVEKNDYYMRMKFMQNKKKNEERMKKGNEVRTYSNAKWDVKKKKENDFQICLVSLRHPCVFKYHAVMLLFIGLICFLNDVAHIIANINKSSIGNGRNNLIILRHQSETRILIFFFLSSHFLSKNSIHFVDTQTRMAWFDRRKWQKKKETSENKGIRKMQDETRKKKKSIKWMYRAAGYKKKAY